VSGAPLTDGYLVHRFAVEMDGLYVAGFGELSGLQLQTEVFEYKEGGLNTYTHKLPGQTSYSNITLKWGSTDSYALWDWYYGIATARKTGTFKKAISVIQFDGEQREIRRWNLREAFPVKWVGPNFNTSASQVGIETLEIAFADFEMVARRGAGP
jgi:phage tail-like protein